MLTETHLQSLSTILRDEIALQHEYEDHKTFAIKLWVWLRCADLTDEQRQACQHALDLSTCVLNEPRFQALKRSPSVGLSSAEAYVLSCLVTETFQKIYHADANRFALDDQMRSVWEHFVPHITFPFLGDPHVH